MTSSDSAAAPLLALYDAQLREGTEVLGAGWSARLGPLTLAVHPGGGGFVTYRALAGETDLPALVGAAVERLREAGAGAIEWKTRGHDHVPGLEEALAGHGFAVEETEAIMIGPLTGLTAEVPLAPGSRVRRALAAEDVRAVSAMTDRAFGRQVDPARADALVEAVAAGDGTQLWVAEVDGEMASAGRLVTVPGTDFVGLWGGATLPAFRGRGLYRALTAARARAALAQGFRYAHSDSTPFSQPILERSGLACVSTTTPWVRVRRRDTLTG